MAYPTGGVAYISPDILSEELRNRRVNSAEEQLEQLGSDVE